MNVNKFFKLIFIICFTLSVFILAIKFTFNFKSLYYFNIEYSNIEEFSGLSREEIKENYNYVIDYTNSKEDMEFTLPSLPASEVGKIHFKEVKDIYKALDFMLIFLIAIVLFFLFLNRSFLYLLKQVSYLLLAIPLIILIPFLINFDASFTAFHKIFFRNDYWIFDPKTDPIINILPQEFFFHCALMILFLIMTASLLLRIILATYSKR